MTLTVRLFGDLKRYAPGGPTSRPLRLEVPEPLTGAQLIRHLGIPTGEHEGQVVLTVNDMEVDHQALLRDGDTISLFEPLAGG